MARTGPAPKAQKHGHGGAGFINVDNRPYTGPGSERELPNMPGMDWFPQVEVWYETLRQMPHCVLWQASDWLFLLETAVLKQNFYSELFGGTVHASMAAELRRREDQMGTTIEARRKLGIAYIDPADEDDEATETEPAAVTNDGTVRPIGSAPSRRQALADEAA
jgi:hypothetical protein